MILTVEVTVENIKAGRPYECELCPVAIALNRTLPAGVRASVAGAWISFYWEGGSCHVFVESDLQRRINFFDVRRFMVPFTFQIEIPAGLPGG